MDNLGFALNNKLDLTFVEFFCKQAHPIIAALSPNIKSGGDTREQLKTHFLR